MMNFILDPSVCAKFAGLRAAFFAAKRPRDYETEECQMRAETRIVRALNDEDSAIRSESASVMEALYYDFYREMGLKPKKVSNPVMQARRVFDQFRYRSVTPSVDMAMEIEYTTLVSFQVYDLRSVGESLRYLLCSDHLEIDTAYRGRKACKVGELVLLDDFGVVHSAYYGNSARVQVTNESEMLLIRVLGIPGIPEKVFRDACDRTASSYEVVGLAEISTAAPTTTVNVPRG